MNAELKPFQQVLVKRNYNSKWQCDLFSHMAEKSGLYVCVGNYYEICIPYEGNEHLLGTTDAPKRWRAESGETYWHINYRCECFEANDYRHSYDDDCYNIGNYFRTRIEAEEMAVKFRALLVKAMLKGGE